LHKDTKAYLRLSSLVDKIDALLAYTKSRSFYNILKGLLSEACYQLEL
jgi:ribosomal protein S15P/S13E